MSPQPLCMLKQHDCLWTSTFNTYIVTGFGLFRKRNMNTALDCDCVWWWCVVSVCRSSDDECVCLVTIQDSGSERLSPANLGAAQVTRDCNHSQLFLSLLHGWIPFNQIYFNKNVHILTISAQVFMKDWRPISSMSSCMSFHLHASTAKRVTYSQTSLIRSPQYPDTNLGNRHLYHLYTYVLFNPNVSKSGHFWNKVRVNEVWLYTTLAHFFLGDDGMDSCL